MTPSLPVVVSVNLSDGGIPKGPVSVGTVVSGGLSGDAHDHEKHNTPLQALSLIDLEDLDALRGEGFDVFPGATGENLTVAGLDVDSLAVGDRLLFSGGVIAELTKIRKPCFVLDTIDPHLKEEIVGRCGMYAKVVNQGRLRAGETIQVTTGHTKEDGPGTVAGPIRYPVVDSSEKESSLAKS